MWFLWFIRDIFQRLFLLRNWESANNVNEVGIIFVGKGTEFHSFLATIKLQSLSASSPRGANSLWVGDSLSISLKNTTKTPPSFIPVVLTLVFFFFKLQPITTLVIVGQDVCVAMLYLLHFSPGPMGTPNFNWTYRFERYLREFLSRLITGRMAKIILVELFLPNLFLSDFVSSVSLGGTAHSLWMLLAQICSPFLIYRQVIVCFLLLLRSLGDLAELHHQQPKSDKKPKW